MSFHFADISIMIAKSIYIYFIIFNRGVRELMTLDYSDDVFNTFADIVRIPLGAVSVLCSCIH